MCARRKVCVCMTEREKTEQDGKRSTESQDENKIKFVEKYDFLMTSVSFLTCSKLSVLRQVILEMTARLTDHGKGSGRTVRRKRKCHLTLLEGQRLKQIKQGFSQSRGAACVGVRSPCSSGGFGLTDSAGERPTRQHLHTWHNSSHPLNTHTQARGDPHGLLVTCGSQHCRLLLSLIFSSYA